MGVDINDFSVNRTACKFADWVKDICIDYMIENSSDKSNISKLIFECENKVDLNLFDYKNDIKNIFKNEIKKTGKLCFTNDKYNPNYNSDIAKDIDISTQNYFGYALSSIIPKNMQVIINVDNSSAYIKLFDANNLYKKEKTIYDSDKDIEGQIIF